ncbi:hypothetical protein EC973_003580 [Apophysomyces ossiformis]|uniref:SET domain-containing protein n=1 Tax=Apophysomyces ossiformis TaxID=679940 RepID=A0A8H7ESS6_9FUNG|nr:hypothetical protein EC973_003580 [Apophysomyces ossiformis]
MFLEGLLHALNYLAGKEQETIFDNKTMSKLGYSVSQSLLTSASYSSTEEEVDIDEDPVDTGAIRCVCSSSDDDGFTIQCERCLIWQHAFCVKIDHSNIPDHYLCDKCEKKYPDLKRSLDLQKHQKYASDVNDSQLMLDSVTQEKKRRHSLVDSIAVQKRKDDRAKGRAFRREKVRSSESQGRVRDEQKILQIARQTSKKPKLSKRISIPKHSLRELDSDDDFPHNFQKARLYQGRKEFDTTTKNVIKSKFVKQIFKEARDRWSQHSRWKGPPWRDDQPIRGMDGTRLKDSSPFVVMDKTMLMPSIPKTSVHALAKSLHGQSSLSKKTSGVRKGVFADIHIPANRYLMEVNGEVVLKSEYKFDPKNQYIILGTQRLHVLFYPTLDLCIDGHRIGSEARFIRRSCHPNAELRSIVVPHSKDDQTIHLGVFTCEEVEKGEEITVGWNWQRGHIAWKRNMEWHGRTPGANDEHQVIDEEEEREKRKNVQAMLDMFFAEFGDCACDDRSKCFIEYLKKEVKDEKRDRPWPEAETPRKKISRRSSSKPTVSTTPTARSNAVSTRHLLDEDMAESQSVQARTLYDISHERVDTSPGIGEHKRSTISEERRNIPKSVSSNSREIVVSGTTTMSSTQEKRRANSPTLLTEENIVIDVTSTSPRACSPAMPLSTSVKDPVSEEELDIDGEIDIGEELPTAIAHLSQEKDGADDEDLLSLSSLSSLSAFEESANETSDREEKGGKATRQARKRMAVRRAGATKSRNKHTDSMNSARSHIIAENIADAGKVLPSKLPCKKIWMRNFLSQVTDPVLKYPNGSSESCTTSIPIQTHAGDDKNNHLEQDNIPIQTTSEKEEQLNQPVSQQSNFALPVIERIEGNNPPTKRLNDVETCNGQKISAPDPIQQVTLSDGLDVDDGELSDASSASTIPLENDDRSEPLKISAVSFGSYETLVSSDDPLRKFSSTEGELVKPLDSGQPITNNCVLQERDVAVEYTHDGHVGSATTEGKGSAKTRADISLCEVKAEMENDSKIQDDERPVINVEDCKDPDIKNASTESQEKSSEPESVQTEKGNSNGKAEYNTPTRSDHAASAHDAIEETKPTKIKLSIQEYLMRRSVTQETNPVSKLQPSTTNSDDVSEEKPPSITSINTISTTLENKS